jgi:hypothetical protein
LLLVFCPLVCGSGSRVDHFELRNWQVAFSRPQIHGRRNGVIISGEQVAVRFGINLFFSCKLPESAWYDFKMELLLLILGACFLGGLLFVGLTVLVIWLVMSSKDKGNRREEDEPRSDDQ